MATGNFYRGDEPYIYVPKTLSELDKIDNEDEFLFIHGTFFNYELPLIYDEIEKEIKTISNKYYKEYNGDIEILVHSPKYNTTYKTHFYNIEIIERDQEDCITYIDYGFVSGYYMGGNMIYLVDLCDEHGEKGQKAVDEVLSAIEKIYEKYCDKYIVRAKLSNGETLYKKVD